MPTASAKEAENGAVVEAGCIYVAPGDKHMLVERQDNGVALRIVQTPQENFCRPSADPMLRSIVPIYQKRLMLVVLTGMGADGLKGAESLCKTVER